MSHIFTQDTLMVDAIRLKDDICPICFRKSEVYSTWVCIVHRPCRHEINDEMFMGDICRMRREFLGLNRTEIAKKLGMSKYTIKKYEWTRCPKSYMEKTEKLVKEIKLTNLLKNN